MFKESLQRLVDNVDGGVAALLMGFDGIAVETYAPSAFDIGTAGMEFSHILTEVRKAAEALEIGGVQEIAIRADKLTIIFRVLSSEYFLALALGDGGNFGKGRYLLRAVTPKLQAELSA